MADYTRAVCGTPVADAPPCPAWNDGQHCFEVKKVRVRYGSYLVDDVLAKTCRCGVTVHMKGDRRG
jgi:hypothetical protein